VAEAVAARALEAEAAATGMAEGGIVAEEGMVREAVEAPDRAEVGVSKAMDAAAGATTDPAARTTDLGTLWCTRGRAGSTRK
jgi:hypothetical protein